MSLLTSDEQAAWWRSSRPQDVVEVELDEAAAIELRPRLLASLVSALDRDALLGELSVATGRGPGELSSLLAEASLERKLFFARLEPELRGLVRARFCGEPLHDPAGLLRRTRCALLIWVRGARASEPCLRLLEELAEAEPRLPIAVVGWRWPTTPRLRDRAREWLVRGNGGARSFSAPESPSVFQPVAELDRACASAERVGRDVDAVDPPRAGRLGREPLAGARRDEVSSTARRELEIASREEAPERARSAAEALLYRALQSHPELAGRFALNERLPGVGEIDLLCASARVAVEIDGWHHFREPSAYRRDRHKDLALQRSGYVVVRVLAQDVLARLEPILETLRALLEERK